MVEGTLVVVVVVGWLLGWLVGGGLWRDGDVKGAAAVVEGGMDGWMTDQALRNNYLHKIPSPFSLGEGQREGEKREVGVGGWSDREDGM